MRRFLAVALVLSAAFAFAPPTEAGTKWRRGSSFRDFRLYQGPNRFKRGPFRSIILQRQAKRKGYFPSHQRPAVRYVPTPTYSVPSYHQPRVYYPSR